MTKSQIKEWVSDRVDCLILDVITTAVKAYYTKYKGLQTMETYTMTKYGRVIIKTARRAKNGKN